MTGPSSTDGSVTHAFKVVVAGPFASGKTTLIQHISDTPVVGTEAPTSGAEASVKDTTTVGMEYGTLSIGEGPDEVVLSLFGVPGQERFRMMWDIVAEGADAFLLLVDAQQEPTWADVAVMGRQLRADYGVPVVVGVNRSHGDPDLVARATAAIDLAGSVHLSCEVVDPNSARETLVAVLLEVLDHLDDIEGRTTDPTDDRALEPA